MNGLAYFKFDNTGNKRRVSYFVEDKKVRSYIFDNKEYYTHPLLNWENLSYSYSFGEEEPDEYLMYHALQDCKKICVSISSSNPGVINDVIENFSNVYECDVYQYRSDPKNAE